jgi:hypothetical protein
LLEDGLGRQREHLAVIGVYQHRPEHLVDVGGGAIAVVLLPALRAVQVGGGDILGAVE